LFLAGAIGIFLFASKKSGRTEPKALRSLYNKIAMGLPIFKNATSAPADGQMELMEHLAELRTRLFRSVAYIAIGMCITYNMVNPMMNFLTRPLRPILHDLSGELITNNIAQGFILWMQVCFISGLGLAFPFVILELWGFIKPALTDQERKPINYLAPFSVLLFFAGVVTGYACLPAAYTWMAGYVHDLQNVRIFQDAQSYMLLTVKIMLAFGLSFELPIILLFLAKVGLLTADLMTKYWRHATVGIAVAAAILTPSNDPLTMMMMAVPMACLYLLSIGLVRSFEPKADGSSGPSLATMLTVALAPVVIIMAVGYWLWRTHMI
jgi:sec-independent protein translocase protein TatC